MKTKDWKPTKPAKALLIGHDPRLQKSETQADYALFADYYFKKELNKRGDKSKYGLAKVTFDQITFLANGKIKPEVCYITNLCNEGLPHAPVGKTVLIPEEKAKEGLSNINKILKENPTIEYVFPMSLQVNYWLQKLGFYNSENEFLATTEPKKIGLTNDPPYFMPLKQSTFKLICGNVYQVENGYPKVIPILHPKQYPLNKKTEPAYGPAYESIRSYFSISNPE